MRKFIFISSLLSILASQAHASDSCVNTALALNNSNSSWPLDMWLEAQVTSPQKMLNHVLETPDGVSVITAKKLEFIDPVNPEKSLIGVPSLHFAELSMSTNSEMYTGFGTFGTSIKYILDGRHINSSAVRNLFTHQDGIFKNNIDHIEISRGGNALYSNSSSGVVSITSKSPIYYPGTTVEFSGGNKKNRGVSIRHAVTNYDKTLGISLNLQAYKGDDYDLSNTELAENGVLVNNQIYYPAIQDNVVDATGPKELILSKDDLDPDQDGNPIIDKFDYKDASIQVQYSPNCDLDVIANAGQNHGGGLFFQDLGVGYHQDTVQWYSLNSRYKDFNFNLSYSTTGDDGIDKPSFLYSNGLIQDISSSHFQIQATYLASFKSLHNTQALFGIDISDTSIYTRHTLYGRNDPNAHYRVPSFFVSASTQPFSGLTLNAVARTEKPSFMDKSSVSSRLNATYVYSKRQAFYLSRDITKTLPQALELYIDFPVTIQAPGVLDVWLNGQVGAENNSYNSGITLVGNKNAPKIDISAVSEGVPIMSYLSLITPPVLMGLAGAGAPENLIAFLANYTTNTTFGTLVPYNVFTPETPFNEPFVVTEPTFSTTETLSAGYKGRFYNSLQIAGNLYQYKVKGITSFDNVAPLYALIGLDTLPDVLASEMSNAASEYLVSNGMPPAMAAPLSIGVADAYRLGANEAVSIFQPLQSAFAAQESNRSPRDNATTHIAAGYVFSDMTRKHYGADLELQYSFTDNLLLKSSFSFINKANFKFENNKESSLNKPKHMAYTEIYYLPKLGFRGNLAANYTGSINSLQGFWNGTIPEKFIVDGSVGYRFSPNWSIMISSTNLFDKKFKAYPNHPTVSRRILANLRWDAN